jgi:hypothetical protein
MEDSQISNRIDNTVTSINQTGGLTAHTINVNNAPLNLTPQELNDLNETQRKIMYRPSLVIHSKVIQGTNATLVKFRNDGFTARNLSVAVILVDRVAENIIVDKKNLEQYEVLCITIVGNLLQPTLANINISIAYEDVEGRRYQQHYTREGYQESVTHPELMAKA